MYTIPVSDSIEDSGLPLIAPGDGAAGEGEGTSGGCAQVGCRHGGPDAGTLVTIGDQW